MLTLITSILPRHEKSEEFVHGFQLLKESFPINTNIIDVNKEKTINKNQFNDFVLFIKEPSVFLSKFAINEMIEILKNTNYKCVIPSNTSCCRKHHIPNFFSYNTYLEFEKSLFNPKQKTIPVSQVESDAFMVKKEFLNNLKINKIFQNFNIKSEFNACIAQNTFIYSYINIYEETRNDVLNFLPENINNLLDIGCAFGNFGKQVKNKLKIPVDGVEFDPINSSIATKKLNKVYCSKFKDTLLSQKYNCITCLDVIEHIENTEKFLAKIHSTLDKDGHLILSIPNIGHWSVVYDLLGGYWDYVPLGILCTTHLRFFTEKSITSTLNRSNFKLTKIKRQKNPIPKEKEKLFKKIKKIHNNTDTENLNTSGFLIMAQKI